MPVRALVLSGGGAKCAFQVGAVDALVNEQQLDFQVIAGVSAGALNAIVLAQGRGPDGLRARLEDLKRLWLGIESERDVYKRRFLGKVLAFVVKDSMLDPTPLREKMMRHVDLDALRNSGREFRAGVTWLETGLYECVDQHHPHVAACTMASASIPMLFPPVRIGGRSGVDGGARNVTPLENAFRAIKDLNGGFPAEPSEIYVVLASPLTMEPDRRDWGSGLKVGERAVAMLVNEVMREDLMSAHFINEAVRSHQELRARLEREIGAAAAARIFADIDFPFAWPQFQYVRLRAIVADREFSGTLEFSPASIREAFEAGRLAARRPIEGAELAAVLRDASGREEAKAA